MTNGSDVKYIFFCWVVVKQHTYSVAGAAILDQWGFSFAATVVFVASPPAPFEFCKFFQPAGDNTPPTTKSTQLLLYNWM